MNKKIIRYILAFIFALIVAAIVWNYKISSWNENEIKEFLLQSEEDFNALANQVFNVESDDGLEVYRNKKQLSQKGINSKLFLQFKVDRIVCYKNHKSHECDEVIITFAGTLDTENRRAHYYEWGVYYSPDNETIGYAGDHIKEHDGEQNSYEYNPENERAHYYTERISDNWFFFKQGVWN